MSEPASPAPRARLVTAGLWLVLAASVAARLPLVLAGGRFFISDEGRYLRGHYFYFHLLTCNWPQAAASVKYADNIGFHAVAALTTALQHAFAGLIPGHGWSVTLEQFNAYFVFEAALLALAPVAAIALVFQLALRLGADRTEALAAAFVLSLSNCTFYFSRHLVPYDAALVLALAGAVVALGPRGFRASLLAGALAGAAFHVYNGYWFLVPLILLARVRAEGCARPAWPSLAAGTLATAVTIALPYAIGRGLYGPEFLQATMKYGRSIVQGLYREGWSLPWEYFWHAEGVFGLAVIALPLGAALADRRRLLPARVRVVAATIAGLYVTWVLVSSVGHLFMMNARTVKPLAPLLALLGGWGLAELWRRRPRLGVIAAVAMTGFALTNFLPHYWLSFPREFEAAALARVGNPKRAASFSGVHFEASAAPVTAADHLLVNAQYLYPLRAPLAVPAGTVVLSAAHPLTYLPYQYDGFTPRQRALLRAAPPRLQLLRLDQPAATPDRPPAAAQATDADWPDGFDSEAAAAR